MKKFVCSVCGYVHEGDSAPEQCPVCKVPAEKFKEMVEGAALAAEHEYGVYGKTVKNNPDISEEDKKFLIENKGGRAVEEAIINDINDKFALLVELKKLIAYLDAKTSPKPTKQDKEPDEHYEPSDCEQRFTTPVDTMI